MELLLGFAMAGFIAVVVADIVQQRRRDTFPAEDLRLDGNR